jgi:hypothetical protein
MGIPVEQYQAMLARLEKNPLREAPPSPAVERELALHDAIMRWCNAQWPRWKYIHARPDKPSGIEAGVADFMIFGPNRRVIIVECKKRDGKQSQEQLCWAAEMRMLGFTVNVVRSMEQFLELVR